MDNLWSKVKPASDDNLIPLINIVFLLLIFFMVAGQMHQQLAADLQLPLSDAGIKSEASELRVEMNAQQQLFLNSAAVTEAQLSEALAQHTASADVRVFLHRQLTAQQIQPLLTLLRSQQITNVTLVSESGG